MITIDYLLINEIVKSFYARATNDILIGYHFRVIDDFESHFPRIADFWQLQLTGKMDHPQSLPFDIVTKHVPLKIKTGEVDRWGLLFSKTLDEYVVSSKITEDDKIFWMQKIQIFKNRLYKIANQS
jgi:truncated hemoglobin YjbI